MAISLAWSRCHLVALSGGRYQLVGIPAHMVKRSCTRLLQLGVTRAKVTGSGVVAFQCPAGHVALGAIVGAFPCCPLSGVASLAA